MGFASLEEDVNVTGQVQRVRAEDLRDEPYIRTGIAELKARPFLAQLLERLIIISSTELGLGLWPNARVHVLDK